MGRVWECSGVCPPEVAWIGGLVEGRECTVFCGSLHAHRCLEGVRDVALRPTVPVWPHDIITLPSGGFPGTRADAQSARKALHGVGGACSAVTLSRGC